ncbi:MAG: HNH endonuclease [Alphaproteobacteria bacterium]|nr:HNH endonuclease [Alphaproteobacteria bacterium]
MPSAPPKHRPAGWKPPAPWATTQTSSTARGYGWKWQQLRKSVLAEEPLCRPCHGEGRVVAAIDVDHIVRRADGGTDDRSNLQPICTDCHKAKTAAERSRRLTSKPRG